MSASFELAGCLIKADPFLPVEIGDLLGGSCFMAILSNLILLKCLQRENPTLTWPGLKVMHWNEVLGLFNMHTDTFNSHKNTCNSFNFHLRREKSQAQSNF